MIHKKDLWISGQIGDPTQKDRIRQQNSGGGA